MSSNLELIEQDIATLQGRVIGILQEMHGVYSQYLEELASVTRQQLITVAFQVCTQMFPDRFLALDGGDRQTLQERINTISQGLEQRLLDLRPESLLPEQEPADPLTDQTDPQDQQGNDDLELDLSQIDQADPTTETVEPKPAWDDFFEDVTEGKSTDTSEDLEFIENLTIDDFNDSWATESDPLLSSHPEETEPSEEISAVESSTTAESTEIAGEAKESSEHQPQNLSLDQRIALTLQQASLYSNQVLQRANILPPAPIELILEIAAKADGRPLGRVPHLLTLMIEERSPNDNDEDESRELESDNSAALPIVAIYLQIEEIEFHHPALTNYRGQLRKLENQLSQLHQQLQQKQKQRLVLKASRAWWKTWKG